MPGGALLVRDAQPADLPAVVALYADDPLGASREQSTDPLPEGYARALREIDADPRHRLVVAEQDGEVVGTLQLTYLPQLTRVGAERAQVEAVRVRSDRRGQGLGGALMTWAVDQARARGCTVLQLTTDVSRTDAQRFYTALGFAASHVGMKLALQP